MAIERRLGVFLVDYNIWQDPMNYKLLFSGMVILQAEYQPQCNKVRYLAAGPMFDKNPEGFEVPEYTATCDRYGVWQWSKKGHSGRQTM